MYEDITPALHFDRESVLPPKFAALLPLDTFDARHGNTITHVSAKGNRPRPESDALRIDGELTLTDGEPAMHMCPSY